MVFQSRYELWTDEEIDVLPLRCALNHRRETIVFHFSRRSVKVTTACPVWGTVEFERDGIILNAVEDGREFD